MQRMQSEGIHLGLQKREDLGMIFKVGGGRLSASAMRMHRVRSACALLDMSEFKRSAHQRAEETSSENGQGLEALFNVKTGTAKSTDRISQRQRTPTG